MNTNTPTPPRIHAPHMSRLLVAIIVASFAAGAGCGKEESGSRWTGTACDAAKVGSIASSSDLDPAQASVRLRDACEMPPWLIVGLHFEVLQSSASPFVDTRRLPDRWPEFAHACPGVEASSAACDSRSDVSACRAAVEKACGATALGFATDAERKHIPPMSLVGAATLNVWLDAQQVPADTRHSVVRLLLRESLACGSDWRSDACAAAVSRNVTRRPWGLSLMRLELAVAPATRPLSDAIVVAATREHLNVDGEKVVPVECTTADGKRCGKGASRGAGAVYEVDKTYKEDSSASSFFIEPLHKRLLSAVEVDAELRKAMEKPPVDPVVAIALDRVLPQRILVELVHTCLRAGVKRIELVVVSPEHWRDGGLRTFPLTIAPDDEPADVTFLRTDNAVLVKLSEPDGGDERPMYNDPDLRVDDVYNAARARLDAKGARALASIGAALDRPWHDVARVLSAIHLRRAAAKYDSVSAYRAGVVTDAARPRIQLIVAE